VGLYESPPKRHPRKPFFEHGVHGGVVKATRFEITEIEFDSRGQPLRLGVNLDGSSENQYLWERICIGCAVASE
jgi:hypothetical protein